MNIQLSTSAILLTPTFSVVVGKYLRTRLNHETFTNLEVNQKKYLRNENRGQNSYQSLDQKGRPGNKLKLLLNLINLYLLPAGQNPRRHPRIPRVSTYKEFQNVRK